MGNISPGALDALQRAALSTLVTRFHTLCVRSSLVSDRSGVSVLVHREAGFRWTGTKTTTPKDGYTDWSITFGVTFDQPDYGTFSITSERGHLGTWVWRAGDDSGRWRQSGGHTAEHQPQEPLPLDWFLEFWGALHSAMISFLQSKEVEPAGFDASLFTA